MFLATLECEAATFRLQAHVYEITKLNAMDVVSRSPVPKRR